MRVLVPRHLSLFLLLSSVTSCLAAIAPTHLFLSRAGPCANAPKMAVSVSELSITRRFYDFMLTGKLNVTANITAGWDIKPRETLRKRTQDGGQCVRAEHYTRRFYDFMLTGKLNVTANITAGWDIKATMQKCPDIRNIDTCDHYRSFTVVRGGCTGEQVPGFHLYSMFFHYLSPKMRCPIKPGQYRIENYPFFTEDNYLAVAEAKISTSVFGYTVRLDGYSDTEQVLCVEAHLRLLYLRNHNWLDLEADATEAPEEEEKSE